LGYRAALVGGVADVFVLEFVPRVPYGVISSRHGRGALPVDLPRESDGSTPAVVSRFCTLDNSSRRAEFR
jgi:hypothetical protein